MFKPKRFVENFLIKVWEGEEVLDNGGRGGYGGGDTKMVKN